MFIAQSKQINTVRFCNKTITLFGVSAFVYGNHCHSTLVIKTHDRGGITTNIKSKCSSTLLVAEHRHCCSFQRSSWGQQTAFEGTRVQRPHRSHSTLYWQELPFRSVVPENIPQVLKKNRHSHSLTHKLRNYNFVAWAKWFTWTRWLRFSAWADVRSLAWISLVFVVSLWNKGHLESRVLNKANT